MEQEQGKINLNNQQIAKAAQDVLKLLNDDERVSIPPSLAKNGSLMVMDKVLASLISGEVILANPEMLKPETLQPPPGGDGGAGKNGEGAEE